MNTYQKCLCAVMIICASSCATIVSKSKWPFSVQTEPSGAKLTITNKKGMEVFNGKTPAAMRLKSGAGFFAKESYTVSLSMDGYETKKIGVECKLNGWYFGNILLGGVIGLLIVDPATGAMYKLDSQGISETMARLSSGSSTLHIIDKNTLPAQWKQHLVQLDQQVQMLPK